MGFLLAHSTHLYSGWNDTYCVTEHQETKEIVSKDILVGILKINAGQSFKILMQTKCSVVWSTCTFCLVNTLCQIGFEIWTVKLWTKWPEGKKNFALS